MKNSHLPLLQALKGRQPAKASDLGSLDEPPRTLQIQHDEIPGLPSRKVGEKISVNLEGHVHSQHNDGHAIMHVSSVKPDSTERTAQENPEKTTPSKTNEA